MTAPLPPTVRGLFCVVLALVLAWASLPGHAANTADRAGTARPTLFVYLHTDAKPAALEGALRERLKSFEVTVFGRFDDFAEAFKLRPPDAILARQVLILDQKVPIAIQGTRQRSDREPFVLVSMGAALEGPLNGRVLGVVDYLGRAGTQTFIAQLLGVSDIKLKRVTKREDLLPLLQFAGAEAVLVPEVALKSLGERSRQPLRIRPLEASLIGLPAAGVVNPQVRSLVVEQFGKLDAGTNQMLGVEAWRIP